MVVWQHGDSTTKRCYQLLSFLISLKNFGNCDDLNTERFKKKHRNYYYGKPLYRTPIKRAIYTLSK